MDRKIIDNIVDIVKAYFNGEDLKTKITSEQVTEIIDGYFSDDNIDSSILKDKYIEVFNNNKDEILDLVNEDIKEENEYSLDKETQQEINNFSNEDIVELFKAEHLESQYYDYMIEENKLTYQDIYNSWKEFFDKEYEVKTNEPAKEVIVIKNFLDEFSDYIYENDLNNQRFI